MSVTLTPTAKGSPRPLPSHLKTTPVSSPLLRSAHAPKSPLKRSFGGSEKDAYGLSLKRMIGTTTASNTGLASHAASGLIAFCTGAAVCVIKVDDNLQVKNRYFLRARPNASAQANVASGTLPLTPDNSGSRIRNSIAPRESGVGFSPSFYESPSKSDDPKNWSVKDRVKAATSVSISPDGRYIAVGETGHNPRVLIYNIGSDTTSDTAPFAILNEHTFGVRCVSFSPCSQYLASIGTINDGCLHIWLMPATKGGQVKLHSSNRCTNIVNDMAWMGKGLITVGLRHVKIWKLEEELGLPSAQPNTKTIHSLFEKLSHAKPKTPTRLQGPSVLNGRNALLGPLLEESFISVTAISEDRSIIATEKGDICILDDGMQRVTKVANADSGITCVAVDPNQKYAWVAGRQGSIRTISLQGFTNPLTPPESPSSRSGSPILPLGCKPANVIAMANVGNSLFLIDSNRSIKFVSLKPHEGLPTPDSVAYEFPAHRSAVQGVRLMPPSAHIQADFYTWSICGTILFWDSEGNHRSEVMVELEQPKDLDDDIRNELKVVEISESGELIVTGDKFGVLRAINTSDRNTPFVVKAHSGEIMSITITENEKMTMISSCGRDRTVQLFTKANKPQSTWALTQTLDDHTASVNRVMFMDKGCKLLSASADRTIVIRELAIREAENGDIELLAFLPIRTIMLKATPLHMTTFTDTSPMLLVSTTGRQVYRFDLNTGKELQVFKCVDDNGESIILDSLTPGRDVTYSKTRLVAGISSTDKSIRLYDLSGTLVEREWGHTEGVTDIAQFEAPGTLNDGPKLTLISTGTDGTVMMWSYNTKVGDDGSAEYGTYNGNDVTASKAPIRKVLSKAEILELTKSPDKDKIKDVKEMKKDGLLASDWASLSDVEQSPSSRKAEAPRPPSKLSQRPKSAIIQVSPPRKTAAPNRNSMVYLPKSNSTPKLVNTSSALLRPERPRSPEKQTADGGATDSDTASAAGTVRRKLRLPGRSRDPSPAPSGASSGNGKSAVPTRRGSFSSRTSIRSSNKEASDAANANTLAEQMARSLGVFRRRVESTQYALKPEVRKELEKELMAALKCIGCTPQTTPREEPLSPISLKQDDGLGIRMDEPMMALLNTYSERLLSVIENKLGPNEGNQSPQASQR